MRFAIYFTKPKHSIITADYHITEEVAAILLIKGVWVETCSWSDWFKELKFMFGQARTEMEQASMSLQLSKSDFKVTDFFCVCRPQQVVVIAFNVMIFSHLIFLQP